MKEQKKTPSFPRERKRGREILSQNDSYIIAERKEIVKWKEKK